MHRTCSQKDHRVVIVEFTPRGQLIAENTTLGDLTLLLRRLIQLLDQWLTDIDKVLTEIINL
jgi:hypothetical protein